MIHTGLNIFNKLFLFKKKACETAITFHGRKPHVLNNLSQVIKDLGLIPKIHG